MERSCILLVRISYKGKLPKKKGALLMYAGYVPYQRTVRRRVVRRADRRGLWIFLTTAVAVCILFCAVQAIAEWTAVHWRQKEVEVVVMEPLPVFALQEVITQADALIQKEPLIPVRDASNPLIVVDAGHGGADGGCMRGAVLEKDINLKIAMQIKKLLNERGYEVLMTREGDETISLEERVKLANENGATIYISIHQNSCDEDVESVHGIETYYSADSEADSKRLAQLMQQQLTDNTDARDRSILANENLYVIRETTMPACLVETGFLSNKKECALLASDEYQKQLAASIVSGVELYLHPKTMYLTFDDGPSPENTNAVLDALKEHNIKATFFLVGKNVERHPEVAKRIVAEGHTIGIHCYSHDYNSLYQSVDTYVADFEKAKAVVYEATGVEAKLFRFPGGSINSYNKKVYEDIAETMTEKGYIYFDWNASLEDAVHTSTPELLLANAKDSTLGRKKIVMLAHDVVYNTTLCINDLIEQFPEYQMLPLTEEVMPIQF